MSRKFLRSLKSFAEIVCNYRLYKKEKDFLIMSHNIHLNFSVYPLVVGQEDKFVFSGVQNEGGSIALAADVTGERYTAEDVLWSSDDPGVADVDDFGTVRAFTTGWTDIHAKLPDGSQADCRIQVIDNIGRLTAQKVTLNTDRLSLNKGEGAALYPIIWPVDYFQNGMLDATFDWTSADEEIAVVDHRGRVWARQCGTTVITASSRDVERTASCEITVVKKPEQEFYCEPLEDMDGGQLALRTGERRTLSLPDSVKEQPVCWRSENESIAGVDQDGAVTAYRQGTVCIWATFQNGGHRVQFILNIGPAEEKRVREVHLSRTELYLDPGERQHVYAVVFPAVLLEKIMQWDSSDERVVRIVRQHINLSGLDEVIVEGVGEGTAVLSARCDDITVNCEVSVSCGERRMEWISLPGECSVDPEEIRQIAPETNVPGEPAVCWLSDDRRIATVDAYGTIKGYAPGMAGIYCIAAEQLTGALAEQYRQLADMRAVAEDANAMQKLGGLLEQVTYAKCALTVRERPACLMNLHVPEETVTADSLCLLWNRKSLLDTEQFFCYEIYLDGALLAKTHQLSYTVRGLEPERTYTFEVAAVTKDGGLICKRQVRASTGRPVSVVLDVTAAPYYAVGDGIATDTAAIQRAIDDCPINGEVLLPEGSVFYSGALFLKSDMTLRVDGILFGSADPDDYPPVVCRWEGYRKLRLTEENQAETFPVFEENVYSHSSLINVGVYDEGEPGAKNRYHTYRVHICGRGMINGNGFSLSYNEGPCWFTHRKGLPIPQSPRRDQNIRGRVLAFYNVQGAYVSDVTVAYGPSWTIHPVFSDRITFDHVKVISMGNGRTGVTEGMLTLNGDGIDPDSSTNINIIDSYFTVGDDAVAIKSGRNREGNELAKPSAYIRVTDCVCVDAKGSFCIGSEQAGGVHDVLFQNLTSKNLIHFGLWIKSAPCRGGLVEDIQFMDCEITDTGGAMQIEYNHGGDENPALELPTTRRVRYENIRFVGRHKFGIRLIGVKGSPIEDVLFRGCRFERFRAKKEPGFLLEHCARIQMEDVDLPEGYEWEIREVRS